MSKQRTTSSSRQGRSKGSSIDPAVTSRPAGGSRSRAAKGSARDKLLAAAMQTIREVGFEAASVDDLCRAAGVTKGAFFHHFKSKDDLGVAAAQHFSDFAAGIFAQAPYQQERDPRARLLGYIDFRAAILQGELPHYTCLLGTMVQEAYATHPAIRQACETHMFGHAATLVPDIVAAKRLYCPDAGFSPESLAAFTQAVLQGAFVLAKARGGADVVRESLEHLRRYVEFLFPLPAADARTAA